MGRNTGQRVIRHVQIIGLKYVFKTSVSNATQTTLGHTQLGNVSDQPSKYVVGASSPKPARASKQLSSGQYESSFVSEDKIQTAKDDGFSVGQPQLSPQATGGQNSTVKYVTIAGVKYAWYSPDATQEPTALASAGLTEADGTETDLVFGAEWPKPPRVQFRLSDGTTYSTYVDPSSLSSVLGNSGVKVLEQERSSGKTLKAAA